MKWMQQKHQPTTQQTTTQKRNASMRFVQSEKFLMQFVHYLNGGLSHLNAYAFVTWSLQYFLVRGIYTIQWESQTVLFCLYSSANQQTKFAYREQTKP